MSAVQQSEAPSQRPLTYQGFIPLLKQLLPKQHGRPGILYAQVYVANQRRAQDQGWKVIDNTLVYTIVGPKGSVDMALMGKGRAINALGHASNKRRCVIDMDVERLTGLSIKSTPLNVRTPVNGGSDGSRSKPIPQAVQSEGQLQGGPSHGRTESGNPTQRK